MIRALLAGLTLAVSQTAGVGGQQQPIEEAPSEMSSSGTRFNLPIRTGGGKQLWTDVFLHGDWRIQRHALTGHHRLLDDKNTRRAWGGIDACRSAFERLRKERPLPPIGNEVVITLHGLGRTRNAMAGIGRYLADEGGYDWLNMSYASTRAPVDAHAEALASVLRDLQGERTVHFVAHSMGNIVIRRYLADETERQRRDREGPRIGRMVMLAPPNQGSALADRLKGNMLFRSLLGASGKQLGGAWSELERQLAIPSFPFGIVAGNFGHGKTSNPLLDGADDLVVSVEETKLSGADDFLVVPAAHTVIMDDPSVRKATLQFLQHGYFASERERQPLAEGDERTDRSD